jgi:hypothetical protein
VPPPDHQHSRYVVVADAKNSAPSANKPAVTVTIRSLMRPGISASQSGAYHEIISH